VPADKKYASFWGDFVDKTNSRSERFSAAHRFGVWQLYAVQIL
jgi:hypothetical protein